MKAKISVFVIRVETIIYLLLYNLHDCNFKQLRNTRLVITWKIYQRIGGNHPNKCIRFLHKKKELKWELFGKESLSGAIDHISKKSCFYIFGFQLNSFIYKLSI